MLFVHAGHPGLASCGQRTVTESGRIRRIFNAVLQRSGILSLLAARYRSVGSMLQRELRDRVLSRRIRLSLAGTSQWEQSRGSNA
jgi:hypothetical protein